MNQISNAKDLRRMPPRSAQLRLGGFAIIGRTIDKCRADIAGWVGEYRFNCPVDQRLFNFKNILAEDFRNFVETGASDDDIVTWFKANGEIKSREEIEEWSDKVSAYSPIDDEESADWFKEECKRLDLDPKKTTLFQMMDKDDLVSFARVV